MRSTTLYNYYKLLEINSTAPADEIKKAYRAKAKVLHPDVNSSPKAHEYFILINEAYEVLIDENKRYFYDLKLKHRTAPQPGRTRHTTQQQAKETQFHYDWASIYNARKKPASNGFFTLTPLVHNLFFSFGMFVGFLFIILPLYAIYLQVWPALFVFATFPGFILVTEGWNGIMGKRSFLKRITNRAKRVFRVA